MAIAFDASSFNSGAGDRSWTHTPSGTPRGVAVVITSASPTSDPAAGNDTIDGVTYGGETLSREAYAVDTGPTEPGGAWLYSLGVNIPTGAQTVVVDDDGTETTVTYACWAVTFTAGGNVEVAAIDTVQNDVENPTATVPTTSGYSGVVLAGLKSGLNGPDFLTAGSGYTKLAGSEAEGHDFGGVSAVLEHGTKSGANIAAGFTGAIDDVALVAAAFQEAEAVVWTARRYKRLVDPVQLGTSPVDLYTVPANTRATIRHVHVQNPSGVPVDFTLSVGTDAASTRLWDDFPVGDEPLNEQEAHTLSAGEKIQAFAETGATLVLVVNGIEEGA